MNHTSRGRDEVRPGRFRVGVISAGRVGSVLGAALAAAGHNVHAVSAVSSESRARASRWLPGAQVLAPDRVASASDLVLLSVPDDALSALVVGLANAHAWRAGSLVVHTSGAHGLDVLAPAARCDAVPMAIHPALSITARPEDAQRLVGARFGVTSAEQYRPVVQTLALELGGEPVWVPDGARPAYHAALTMAANHLTTLVNDSVEVLRNAGVSAPEAMLAPLLSGSLDNALRLGDRALTGPVSRGDAHTVAGHLDVLGSQAPQTVAAYVAMARRTTSRALAHGRISEQAAAGLLDVLARTPENATTHDGEPGGTS